MHYDSSEQLKMQSYHYRKQISSYGADQVNKQSTPTTPVLLIHLYRSVFFSAS
jgi:hypothetical protein